MYRLLALDLDGTLVRSDGEIDDRDRRAIAKLRAHRVEVTIATGRLYAATAPVADTLQLSGPIVCGDGAHIRHHPEGGVLQRHHIAGEQALALREALGQQRLARFVMRDDAVLLDSGGAMFEGYVSGWTPHVEKVDSVLASDCWEHPDGVSGVVAIGLSDRIEAVRAAVAEVALNVTHFDVRQAPGVSCLLVRADGVSKAEGLSQLADHHGLDMAEVVAVGDWLNDQAMLEAAGRSFAMGHAPDAVKQAATDRLGHKDGVARAIELAWPELFD